MHTQVKFVESNYKKKKVPAVRPGDIVKVTQKIRESGKEKTQAFQGIVIDIKKPNELNYSITVRKISFGIGVEKVFPVHAPMVSEIDVLKRSKVRRANLGYLRGLADKKTRSKLKSKELKDLAFIIPKEESVNQTNDEDEKKLTAEGHAEVPEVEERLDEEITEIDHSGEETHEGHSEASEDAMTDVVTSTEELAKKENELAERNTEESDAIKAEDEESEPGESFAQAVDKTEDETTRDQEKS